MSVLFWQNLKKRTTLELSDKIMVGKNANGKTMYADLNQVRNLIGAVANGAIVPQIVPSNTLGSPAEAKIYYAPAGTYTTNTNIPIVTTANFNLLIWDLTRWTVMQIPITFEEQRLSDLEDKIGDLAVQEYFKEMGGYTDRIGGGSVFASKTQLVKNGLLKQLRIQMNTPIFVEVKAVLIDANVAVTIHNFGIFETTTQGDKQVIDFEDSFLLPAGSYLAVRNTAGTGLFFDGNQLAGSFEISTLGAVSNSFEIGFDFSVIESNDAESLLFRVLSLERKVQKQGNSLQAIIDDVEQNTTDIAENYNELAQLVQAQFTKNTQQDSLLFQHSSKLAIFENEFLEIDANIVNIHNADASQNQQLTDLELRFWGIGIEGYLSPIENSTLERGSPSNAYGNRDSFVNIGVLGKMRIDKLGVPEDEITVIAYSVVTLGGEFGGGEVMFEEHVYPTFTIAFGAKSFDFLQHDFLLTEGMVLGIKNSNGTFISTTGVGGFSTSNSDEGIRVDYDFEIFTAKTLQSVALKAERAVRVNNKRPAWWIESFGN
jgi:hypothetical protein